MTDNVLPTEFLFITDPGHGWLVCTIDDVNEIGLSIYDFSAWSFVEDGVLFLEEDADATLFALAYEASTGREIKTRTREVPHFSRNRARLPGWFDDGKAQDQKHRALRLLIASRRMADDPHEDNCPAVDGFGCRCVEAA